MPLTTLERMRLQDLNDMLTMDDYNKGYRLVWYNRCYSDPAMTTLSKSGERVYVWFYEPTMGEVWDKINDLEKTL